MKIEKLEYYSTSRDGYMWERHPNINDIIDKLHEIIDKLNESDDEVQIANAPTIDAEPIRHGHWVVDEDGNIKCSECGHHSVGDNYCERCGAKMDEVSE